MGDGVQFAALYLAEVEHAGIVEVAFEQVGDVLGAAAGGDGPVVLAGFDLVEPVAGA
nr:hypothetical protein [Streptomyces hokutonensis]